MCKGVRKNLTKEFSIKFTTPENQEINHPNEQVIVVQKIKEANELDQQVLGFTSEREYGKAVELSRASLLLLQEAANLDQRGLSKALLLKAKKNFTSLKNMRDIVKAAELQLSDVRHSAPLQAKLIKQIHHTSYTNSGYSYDLA